MFLSVLVSVNVWLLSVVVARFVVPCLSPIPWSMLLTLFVVSLLVTMTVHMYHWKCWRYIRHGPQRLRSFTDETSNRNVCVGVIFLIWLEATTFVLLSWLCCQELNPLVFLVVVPAALCSYTASICPFVSSDSDSLELSSNVNTGCTVDTPSDSSV